MSADPALAFARETLRSRRRALVGFAVFLMGLGGAYFAAGIWFTDDAHLIDFMGAAAASVIGSAVLFVQSVRLGRPSSKN